MHLQETDLSHVSSIDWSVPGIEYHTILSRCRSLREIRSRNIIPGSFDWAVQEKKDMERLAQDTILPTPAKSCFDVLPPQPAYLTHGLVPLARVNLQEHSMQSQDLDAIAFAFSQSLEQIVIRSLHASNDVQMIHLGNGWASLPLLRELQMDSLGHRVALDPLLVAQCPLLFQIMISDKTFEYSCQDIVPWVSAQTPDLWRVYLKGWSALTFNPTILESTKKLVYLSLLMTNNTEGFCFIPPVEELDTSYGHDRGQEDEKEGGDGAQVSTPALSLRSQWTWNWYLPYLEELLLTSEFAYRFEFRMLHGCPSLRKLRLYMRTMQGHHTRLISESDLFVSGPDESQGRIQIVAPRLKSVSIIGHWVIEDPSVLSQLFGSVFPKLKRLTAVGWSGRGFTVEALVNAVRTKRGHMQSVKTQLGAVSAEEEEELGLHRILQENKKKGPGVAKNRLFCSRIEYVVRKEDVLIPDGVRE
jgi:hypothetical protein